MGLSSFIKKDAKKESEGIKAAFGVFGSAIRIKMRQERWSGQSEYYKCLKNLALLPTIGTIYVVSKIDLDKLSVDELKDLDPHNKIVNCPKVYAPKKYKRTDETATEDENLDNQYAHIRQMSNNMISEKVKIDFGLFFTSQGNMTVSALPGYLRTVTGEHTRAKVLEMTMHYASPLIDFVNRFNMPWFMIATDPRYVKAKMSPRDFSNLPREIIGQFNEDCTWLHIKEYVPNPEIITSSLKHTYSGIEKFNTTFEKIHAYDAPKKNKFVIVSAQVDGPGVAPEKDFRFQQLKTWILDKDINKTAVIYGSWDDNRKAGWPQFKGFIATEDLDNTFRDTKYTLILPTKAGWATSKPWEMLSMGVLPFFHSHYDFQNNMIPEDHFLRCKTPDDFYAKMDMLDADDEKRKQLLKRFQDELISDGPNGQFLVKALNERFKKHDLNISI